MAREEQKEKISKVLLPLLAVALLLIVIFIQGVITREEVQNYATGYDDLTVFVENANSIVKIKSWKSEEGIYYFFLPSFVNEESKVTIGNLHESDKIVLNQSEYVSTSDLWGVLEWNVPYSAQLWIGETKHDEESIVFLKSENLASLYIETESGGVEAIHADKAVKEGATLLIKDALGTVEYDNKIEYIKARGNSTFLAYDKKAYQIRLFNKAELLGMEKAEKWILLANYVDNSLLRNQIVYNFANQYAEEIHSIEGVYVDLYVNNEYLGNYYLCEKVEVEENRLEIVDLEDANEVFNSEQALEKGTPYISEDGNIRAVQGLISPENITGGYLVEIIPESKYEVARSAFRTKHGKCFEIISPENATIEEAEYICALFNEMEDAIYQEDGTNPNTNRHFTEYIDLESWGIKYAIEEFFHDPDAPAASAFFYKEADEPLIYAGPMWDYDRALGSWGFDMYYIDQPQGIGYYSVYADELMQHEVFEGYVKAQFKERICPYMEGFVEADIRTWQKEIEASAFMNEIRWPGTNGYYASLKASVEYIIYFLEERTKFLKEVWQQGELYHTVSFLDYAGKLIDKSVVKHGDYLQKIPTTKNYVSIFNGWKSVQTGKTLDTRLPVLEDAVYQSQWIDANLVLENGLNMAEIDIDNVDVEAIEAVLEAIKEKRGDMADE